MFENAPGAAGFDHFDRERDHNEGVEGMARVGCVVDFASLLEVECRCSGPTEVQLVADEAGLAPDKARFRGKTFYIQNVLF